MTVIGVTRLRVRSVRFLPAFAVHFLRTRSQVRQAAGFRGGSVLPDRHWTFWTMTAWDSQESMRRYMTTPPHRTTMPYLLDWCDEASGSLILSERRRDAERSAGAASRPQMMTY